MTFPSYFAIKIAGFDLLLAIYSLLNSCRLGSATRIKKRYFQTISLSVGTICKNYYILVKNSMGIKNGLFLFQSILSVIQTYTSVRLSGFKDIFIFSQGRVHRRDDVFKKILCLIRSKTDEFFHSRSALEVSAFSSFLKSVLNLEKKQTRRFLSTVSFRIIQRE